MEADEGNRVSISFVCRYEDGTVYDYADRDILSFVIGEGNSLPSLEKGVIGMQPGDIRTIRVSAAELQEYPFQLDEAPGDAGFPAGIAGAGSGDEFSQEEDDAVISQSEVPVSILNESQASGADLFFDVEMVKVEDAEVELEDL